MVQKNLVNKNIVITDGKRMKTTALFGEYIEKSLSVKKFVRFDFVEEVEKKKNTMMNNQAVRIVEDEQETKFCLKLFQQQPSKNRSQ